MEDNPKTIRCYVCKTHKTADNFSKSNIVHNVRRCKPCSLKKSVIRYHKNIKKTLLGKANKRAKRENIPFDLTIDDIYIPSHCPLLGIKLKSNMHSKNGTAAPNSPSIDRIYPHLGYIKGNIIVISYAANAFKNSATPQQLIGLARNLYNIVTNHYPLTVNDMKTLWPQEYVPVYEWKKEEEQGEGAAMVEGGVQQPTG
jgi:hypothetical protein